jgi:hypothetical protein
MYVGITSAGTFRSDDGGETWLPRNKNVAGDFLPDPHAEVGQCTHKLLLHPQRPDRLWQQNHCGVYRSDDRGDSWLRLDGNGLPSGFGFPLMLDPNDPDAAFVIPEKGFEYHYGPEGRLAVYRTRDGGETWESMSNGLPRSAPISPARTGSTASGCAASIAVWTRAPTSAPRMSCSRRSGWTRSPSGPARSCWPRASACASAASRRATI